MRVTQETYDAMECVAREREEQDIQWGVQRHDLRTWLAILTEEVGEVAQEVLANHIGDKEDLTDLRAEVVQVAAVAVAIVEFIDHGAAGLGR